MLTFHLNSRLGKKLLPLSNFLYDKNKKIYKGVLVATHLLAEVDHGWQKRIKGEKLRWFDRNNLLVYFVEQWLSNISFTQKTPWYLENNISRPLKKFYIDKATNKQVK